MQRIILLLSALIVLMVWSSCRKDFEYTPNPGNLEFSKDTVFLDTVFSNISSSTYTLKVYNPNRDAIEIPTIRLKQGQNSFYRLNVDGVAGKEFTNIPILAQDSLYIFIETTVELSNGLENEFLYTDAIAFEGGMTTQEVQLVTLVKDAVFLYPATLADGTKETLDLEMGLNGAPIQVEGFYLKDDQLHFNKDKPYVVYGYAVVPENKTLLIDAGSRIHFHKDSGIYIENGASLQINGSQSLDQELLENEVILEGDRLEPEYSEIPAQWGTIWIAEGSMDNTITYATLKNATVALMVVGDGMLQTPTLTLRNTKLHNSSSTNLWAKGAYVIAENTVLGGAGRNALRCELGGRYEFTHCTIANYWSHGQRTGTALYLGNYTATDSGDLVSAQFNNCIIDGSALIEISLQHNESNAFNFTFDHSLIKFTDSAGQFSDDILYDFTDITKYNNVYLNQNADFKDVIRNKFWIGEASSARDKALLENALKVPFDILGTSRTDNPDIGAYEYTPDN